jgi:hypothetical protein
MPPLKVLNNFKYKWLFSSSLFDIRLGKNVQPSMLMCDPIHASLVLSLIEGGARGASTSSIVEEGD